MKENLFHGKRKDNGEWVEGYYCAFNGVSHRIYTGYAETDCGEFYPDYYEVIPETVGQYTELPDKNGRPIFEGNIIRDTETSEVGKICFDTDTARFVIEFEKMIVDFSDYNNGDVEVIGNIYDNPELIKE
jgi:uncharacterized phage protein (TIGR01671 family)